MQTSCFYYFRDRPGAIRISVGLPRFIKGASKIPTVPELFPRYFATLPGGGRARIRMTDETRQRSFHLQLKDLDAQTIYDQCVQLVAPHEPILLCFEKPPFGGGHWCHRRIAAEWFETQLGIEVPECGSLF